ncbi:glycosyltransferase [Microbacterium horticulturae]|uniref:Glycosyltransferase n=1 Tax=Microbacterium horticulturae TaxID=3028316 RepID=A0ABY8BW93_9MICO|nr:glycosyltransferase [Microbacterium sp. KACC 23027]WEG08165.1 glycosyltransferase [Microbacterium sp. KACC 23027]
MTAQRHDGSARRDLADPSSRTTRSDVQTPGTCICIATYRRPLLLAQLLQSVAVSVEERTDGTPLPRVLVIDNDGSASAKEIVRAAPIMCDYIREPRPGIVAARNAALRNLTDAERWVIFVDDDEVVNPDWYSTLMAARRLRAAIVTGPVVPRFSPDTPKWITSGGFFQRPRRLTGDVNPHPATNNALVDRTFIKKLANPWFDEAYSITGGSDSDFFGRIVASGGTSVWCDEAIVSEDIPQQRANFRWIFRRNVRLGNVTRRVTLRDTNSLMIVILGTSRCLLGFFECTFDLTRGRVRQQSLAHFAKGIGMVRSIFGHNVSEYRR